MSLPVSGFPQFFQANVRTNTVCYRSFLDYHFHFSIHDFVNVMLDNLNIEIFINKSHTYQ
jgi:hypothetical protein